jgi:hypothetical protein
MRGAFYIVTTICGDFFLYSVCVFSFLFFGFFFCSIMVGGRYTINRE